MKELKLSYKKPFTVQAKGNSMMPTIEAGDWLLGDSDYPIEDDAIVLVQLDDESLTCGRLSIKDDRMFLTFDNHDYPPIDVTEGTTIHRIVGRIVKITREP